MEFVDTFEHLHIFSKYRIDNTIWNKVWKMGKMKSNQDTSAQAQFMSEQDGYKSQIPNLKSLISNDASTGRFKILQFNPKLNPIQPLECKKCCLVDTIDSQMMRCSTVLPKPNLNQPTNLYLSYHTFWYWWYSNVGYNREFLERFRILKFNPKLNLIQPLESIKSRLISQYSSAQT